MSLPKDGPLVFRDFSLQLIPFFLCDIPAISRTQKTKEGKCSQGRGKKKTAKGMPYSYHLVASFLYQLLKHF